MFDDFEFNPHVGLNFGRDWEPIEILLTADPEYLKHSGHKSTFGLRSAGELEQPDHVREFLDIAQLMETDAPFSQEQSLNSSDDMFGKDGASITDTPISQNSSSESGAIVITGIRPADQSGWLTWGDGNDAQEDKFLPIGEDPGFQPLADEDVVEIHIDVGRPLTVSENAALEHLKESIAAIEAAINALADTARLTLPNGAEVTGAELKAIWAKTDFYINDNEPYGNLSYRGEADMNNGNPQISFNIGGDGLDAYDNFVGGMNYLVAHELGHLTQWGTPLVYSEVTANDIARALLSGAGLPYLANPQGGGYTDGAPMQFSVT